MRVANQCKLRAILIGRAVSFGFLDLVQRKNNFRGLARKCRGFQRHGRTITLVRKVEQHLLLDSRVRIVHDLIILSPIICHGKVQLLFDQLFRLLREELRRYALRHIVPVTFPFQLVDGRKMLFAIRANVSALAFCRNSSAKGIVRIVFNCLENLHLRRARGLVGVEHNIHTVRQVVRVHCHALQVVAVVHHDTNLRIMGIAQIQISHSTTNLHHTVLCQSAFIAVANGNAG